MPVVFEKAIIVAALLCTLTLPVVADESGENFGANPGETWLINTRRAPPCGRLGNGLSRVQFSKLNGENWAQSSFEKSIVENAPSLPTIVYVHGNRTTSCDAIREGMNLKNRLASCSQRPFNFAVWSWPSNRVSRKNRIDVRTKATRSDAQAYYLAIWLRGVKENNAGAPVSLIGYSFGSRIIAGALHMLGGGRLAGRTLPEIEQDEEQSEQSNVADNSANQNADDIIDVKQQQEEWKPLRAVLVAGALDANWLLPGHRNGLALSQVDRMLVTKNAADPVLRWYPLISNCRNDAIGYVGPRSCGYPYSGNCKIFSLDVSCPVGRDHSWCRYISSWKINAQLAHHAFLDTVEPSTADSSQ